MSTFRVIDPSIKAKKNKQNFNKTLVDALSNSANVKNQKNDLEWL